MVDTIGPMDSIEPIHFFGTALGRTEMAKLNEIKAPAGGVRKRKRLGCGPGSGQGKPLLIPTVKD